MIESILAMLRLLSALFMTGMSTAVALNGLGTEVGLQGTGLLAMFFSFVAWRVAFVMALEAYPSPNKKETS